MPRHTCPACVWLTVFYVPRTLAGFLLAGAFRRGGFEGQADETHVSAQQAEARANSRIPCAHGDQGRARGVEAPARERARCAHALSLSVHRAGTTTATDERPAAKQNSGRERLRKANRLPDSAAFDRVFRGADKSRDAFFTVLSKPNGVARARLGLAISKKHCRSATGRNRLKRLVRESFRRHQGALAGRDVVVMAQAPAAGAANPTLFASLERHWQRIRRRGTG